MNADHTLIAFYESIPNATVLGEINGVADQSQTFDASSRLQAPYNAVVLAAYAMGINATAFQIDAPSLRSFLLPNIYPVNPTADVRTLDGPVVYGDRGPRLLKAESVAPLVSRGGADAQPCIVGLWLSDKRNPIPGGPITTVLASASPTIVAGSWVFGALTFAQSLPAGEYAVVGLAVQCNDATFARLVYPGAGGHRPGVVVQDAYGDLPTGDHFRYARFGHFGTFIHNAPPSIEILGDTAGAETAAVYLDVVKIR